ncbi:hypothetical protein [Facklamia sp. 7083-14-GEN3]|uniref:hypothetical protein n=1 Tax=Facklamia sp. 7083-14-GEN3 TaxID=2973478 RepID=UPI00215C8F8C|nr:hypothetical protein [Facklamia sp. 7083-14-GEN3]MCR8968622.1 hypothetical protein [Facklamia sp. 7083-14-GEN3]
MKNKKQLFKSIVIGILFLIFSQSFKLPISHAQTASDYYKMSIDIVNDLSTEASDQEGDQFRTFNDSLTEFDVEYTVEQLAKEYDIEPKRTTIDLEEDYRMESLLLKEDDSYGMEIIAIYKIDQLVYLASQYYGPIDFIEEQEEPVQIARAIAKDLQIRASLKGDIMEEDGLLVEVSSKEKQEDYHLAYFREQAVLSDYLVNEFLTKQNIEGINSQLTLALAETKEIPEPKDKKSDDLEADNRSLEEQLKGLVPASLNESEILDLKDYEESIIELEDQIKLYQSKTQTEITADNFSLNSINDQLGPAIRSEEKDDFRLEEYYFLSTNKLVYLGFIYSDEQLLQANFHHFDENSFEEGEDYQSLLTDYENNGYITLAEIEEALGSADSAAYYMMTGFSYYSWVSISDNIRQLTASVQQDQIINLQINESND